MTTAPPLAPPTHPAPAAVAPPVASRMDRWRLPLLLLIALPLLCAELGQHYRWSSREIRHAEIIREMAASGEYVVPHLLGRLYPDKPPVMHVPAALLTRWHGEPSMAIARLPSAVSALVVLTATYLLGCRWLGPAAAWLGSLMLLSFPGFVNFGRQARPDMLLTAAILLACLGLAYGLQPGRRWALGAFLAAGVAMGVAIVTKGPYGLLVPAFFLALAPLGDRAQWRWPRWCELVTLGMGAVAVAGGWAWLAYRADGGAYLAAVIFQRDLVTGSAAHAKPFYYYLGPVLATTAPAGLLLPWVVIMVKRRGYSPAAAVALAVVALLSCVPGKRNHYLLPFWPFYALALAECVYYFTVTRPAWRRRCLYVIGLCLAGSLVYVTVGQQTGRQTGDPEWRFARQLAEVIPPEAPVVCHVIMAEPYAWTARRTVGLRETGSIAETRYWLNQARPGAYLVIARDQFDLLRQQRGVGRAQERLSFREPDGAEWLLCWYTAPGLESDTPSPRKGGPQP